MRQLRRTSQIFLITLALASAVSAALIASSQYSSAVKNGKTIIVKTEQPDMTTIVIATQQLRYGTVLTKDHLREINWPEESIPKGAVQTIDDLLNQNGKIVALSFMEIGEPVLQWKVTGPGQRATLSAMLDEGRKAVSIRVNEVLGVGGFVLPGDHVDVLLTRTEQTTSGSKKTNNSYTDILLQNIRVLAVDQMADDRNDKPALARTVTVEVDIMDAQKLVLASTVGTLSLTLRSAGMVNIDSARRITLRDLTMEQITRPIKPDTKIAAKPPQNTAAMISVTRAMEKSDYEVHRE